MVFDAAPFDSVTFWFSIILLLITFLISASPFWVMYVVERKRWIIGFGVVAVTVCCCIFPLSYASVPHSLVITSEAIILNRYVRDIVIPFEDIDEVREIGRFKWQRSMAWNPGVFGYIGVFRSPEYGKFNGYVTDWRYSVLITRHNARPFVISPADPPGFVYACRQVQNHE